LHRRALHEVLRGALERQQRLDVAAECGIPCAGRNEKRFALVARPVERFLANPFNLEIPISTRGSLPPASSCNNHSFANRQSRFTVSAETFRASAVSSMLSAPKKRSSTTRAFRGWIPSRRVNAWSIATRS
jgi:hypothetical protein